jgi:2-oxoglutarate ferredoxin oxidoreductase subunit alpha
MKKLLQGNEAIVEGAIKAGIGFFAAYPITPASEIMHTMAKKNVEFVHAEDEIASISMVIGASLAGAKSMTSTSGPGMSLKQEGIGLAHMMEIPTVIVNVQRVGPSTGMPTLPSQADILQTKYGSHGDYYPIVFYPNSVEECYRYAIEAFNAAEESLSPVTLLSDGFIGHLYENIDIDNIDIKIVNRKREPFGKGNRHFTGLVSEYGIPKTKDPAYYRRWLKEMKEKIDNTAKNYNFHEYNKKENSDTLLIAYGITSRVIAPLKDKYSIFRPIRIFPILDNELIEAAKNHKNIVVIEMNDGQYKGEIEKLLKKDIHLIDIQGGSISLKEIECRLKQLGV